MSESLIDQICRRASFPRLVEPAPAGNLLEKVFQSALRAPDHMKLKPWRYLVVEGDARANLGELFYEAAKHDQPDMTEAQKKKYQAMPLRAPMIIIGVSKNDSHPKVPVEEQMMSCGLGMGYMLLALQSIGFGGIWRTGPLATNAYVKRGLNIEVHETFSLIKDKVMCRDKGEITVKGFARPVPIYQIVDLRRDLGAGQSFIEHETEGFAMYLDTGKVDQHNKEAIVSALERATEKLKDTD